MGKKKDAEVAQAADTMHSLSEANARFASLAASIPGVIYQRLVTPQGDIRYTYISAGAKDLFGVPHEEIIADPQALFDCHSPEYRATFRERLLKASKELSMWDVEASIITRDGEPKFTRALARPRRLPDGSVLWDGVILDTTRARRAEGVVQRLGRIVDESSNEIYVYDADTLRIIQVNRSAISGTGYSREELLQMSLLDLKPELNEQHLAEFLGPIRRGEQHEVTCETVHRRKDGSMVPVEVRMQFSGSELPPIFVELTQDITKRKRAEEQLRWQANFDTLTTLPNRTVFFDRLSNAIAVARRQRGLCGVLFIDLDQFKDVNDTLGHLIGDNLLQLVAHRLKSCVRKVDTVARLGGDEFAVVLPGIAKSADASVVAEKIMSSLTKSFIVDGHEVFARASIGITIFPYDAEDEVSLLRKADVAMYRSKEEGRNTYRFYSPEMNSHAFARIRTERDLRRALVRDQLDLYYQPIIDLNTHTVAGAEALLRWRHPKKGLVLPGQFINIAETSDVIIAVGEWVLRTAVEQVRKWKALDMPGLNISINVSGRQIKRGLLVETVRDIVNAVDLAPHRISFEITESLTVEDTSDAIDWLGKIKSLGIGLSVDDFGTGYSSLRYLKRFPVDGVKIDRTFIQDLEHDSDARALVEAIIAMAHSLGMKTVAEGVETIEQLILLKSLNCDYGQGYYFSHPVGAADFERLLHTFGDLAVTG